MRALAGLAIALALAACAQPGKLPKAPVPAGGAVSIQATPVAERPANVSVICEGACLDWTYQGGLALTSADTSRLHGLSDLEVLPDGRLVAVGDDGDLLRARLALDAQGRLAGVTDAVLSPLKGPDGRPVQGKAEGDAEGLAFLANGDMLVSFERNHRVWLYPANGGPPRAVASPAVTFPENGGMEALSADPARGANAYLTGGEDSGQTFLCVTDKGCELGPAFDLEPNVGLVAVRRLPEGRTAWLFRGFSALRGAWIHLRILDGAGRQLAVKSISRPDSVDNFEGLAAIPRQDGSVRFYLLSDDNFSPTQRTLLVAYDWRPAKRAAP